jgi:CheY-like chemotaxis protein
MTAMVLLIDDKPESKSFDVHIDQVARTYNEAIKALQERRWDLVLLDHDLGDFDEQGKERHGHSIATWIEEHVQYLPRRLVAVSRNPYGAQQIEAAFESAQRRAQREGIDVEGAFGVEA